MNKITAVEPVLNRKLAYGKGGTGEILPRFQSALNWAGPFPPCSPLKFCRNWQTVLMITSAQEHVPQLVEDFPYFFFFQFCLSFEFSHLQSTQCGYN